MGLCLTLMAGHLAYDLLGPSRLHAASRGQEPAPEPKSDAEPKGTEQAKPSTIALSESKFNQAKITTEPARMEGIATEVGVVGMIEANADRKVEVRPRAAGIVRRGPCGARPEGEARRFLVILDSPEIGTARLNLRQSSASWSTARYEANWKSEIAANVGLLIPELRKGINTTRGAEDVSDDHPRRAMPTHEERPQEIDAGAIEKRFADKQLGAYRGTLLQALAEFDIAAHEEEKTASLRRQKIVGEHPMIVAMHTREAVQAKFEARDRAGRLRRHPGESAGRPGGRQAEAAVIDAAQRLRILGVAEDIHDLLNTPSKAHPGHGPRT